METEFAIYPVGMVRKKNGQVWIEIFDEYKDALDGLAEFSHMDVYYWFDKNDVPEKRNILKVHPQKNRNNPLTGVFATHSPMRPNLIGATVCRILSVIDSAIVVDSIDAFDNTPIIDIKCHAPRDPKQSTIKVPNWAKPRNP